MPIQQYGSARSTAPAKKDSFGIHETNVWVLEKLKEAFASDAVAVSYVCPISLRLRSDSWLGAASFVDRLRGFSACLFGTAIVRGRWGCRCGAARIGVGALVLLLLLLSDGFTDLFPFTLPLSTGSVREAVLTLEELRTRIAQAVHAGNRDGWLWLLRNRR